MIFLNDLFKIKNQLLNPYLKSLFEEFEIENIKIIVLTLFFILYFLFCYF